MTVQNDVAALWAFVPVHPSVEYLPSFFSSYGFVSSFGSDGVVHCGAPVPALAGLGDGTSRFTLFTRAPAALPLGGQTFVPAFSPPMNTRRSGRYVRHLLAAWCFVPSDLPRAYRVAQGFGARDISRHKTGSLPLVCRSTLPLFCIADAAEHHCRAGAARASFG